MNYEEYLTWNNMGSVGFFDTSPAVCAFLEYCQGQVAEELAGRTLPTGEEELYRVAFASYIEREPTLEDDLRERILSWAPCLDKLPPDSWAMYVADICNIFIAHSA